MSDSLLLWTDFETTGLEWNEVDTALECAWLITDDHLRQLTPLRQRYLKLGPSRDYGLTPLPNSMHWNHSGGVKAVVLEMHEESGLTQAWRDAYASHVEGVGPDAWRFYTDGFELQEAISTDIDAMSRRYGKVPIHIAGSGVSHFDQALLGAHCPKLGARLHYRAFDPSVAGDVVGLMRPADADMATLLEGIASNYQGNMIELENYGHLHNEHLPGLLTYGRAHRADFDVLQGLAWARLLRSRITLEDLVAITGMDQ